MLNEYEGSRAERPSGVVIIGIGNFDRGDDGAGIVAARRLRERRPGNIPILECRGEVAELIEAWRDADSAILIDAIAANAPPGTILQLDLRDQRLPERTGVGSTHGLGLPQALELSRVLDSLPRSVVLYGVVAEAFQLGSGLSSEVERATERVVETVLSELTILERYRAKGFGEEPRSGCTDTAV